MPASEIWEKFKNGTLKDSHGNKVTSRKQARAIMFHYLCKEGKASKEQCEQHSD